MTPVTVRPATPNDYEALCAVVAAVDRFHADLVPHRFRRIEGPARPVAWLTGLVESPDGLLLVAERGGELVGFLEGGLQRSPEGPMHLPRRLLMVDGVGVLEAHRRAGVGRALMEAAHAWARARGLDEVELSVHAANRDALAFYERLGYTPAVHRLSRRP
jgi:ribosomal protein S18 acetylase RimI-like enzyme